MKISKAASTLFYYPIIFLTLRNSNTNGERMTGKEFYLKSSLIDSRIFNILSFNIGISFSTTPHVKSISMPKYS